LAAWLTVSPLIRDDRAVAAPPPEGASSPARAVDAAPPAEKRGGDEAAQPGEGAIRSGNVGNATSVRPRGLEAPIQLRPEAQPTDVEEQDGPVPASRTSRQDAGADARAASRTSPREATPNRVWPLPRGEYTFTQRFGCVTQIAAFYQAGSGCPADAPVVHTGIDLAAPEGTPFYAAASGWVTEAGPDREVGVANTRIIIQHDGRNEGMATEYLHWIAAFVKPGDYVRAGEPIGEVGSVGYSTGPHLHFGLIDLASGEHLDPIRWLPKQPGTEGYRGITPSMKAHLRLPAGTTAGLPETADPSPPPPPERQNVPDRPPRNKDERSARKKKKAKRTRDNQGTARHDSAAPESAPAKTDRASSDRNEPTADATDGGSEKQGRNRDRTRKRERNKDGKASESRKSGESETAAEPKPRKHDNNRRNNHGGDNAGKRDEKPNRKNDRGNKDTGSQKPSGGKKNQDKPAGEPGTASDPGNEDSGAGSDTGDETGVVDPTETGGDTPVEDAGASPGGDGEETAPAPQAADGQEGRKGKRDRTNSSGDNGNAAESGESSATGERASNAEAKQSSDESTPTDAESKPARAKREGRKNQ
jgi:murein DD-endopeptidase MepM/ murein hydrolase activator NlpD